MPLNAETLKKHWPVIVGGLVGLFVLYYLYESFASSSSASSSGTSATNLSGADQVTALASAASLQNAQTNAQVETTAYQAETIDNQTNASLQASLAQTAAQLSATNLQTQATEAVDLGAQNSSVSIQKLQSNQAVSETAIEGDTLKALGADQKQTAVQIAQANEAVDIAQIGVQSEAISTTADLISSGKLNKGGQGGNLQVAALASAEGQNPSAVVAANQPTQVKNSTASTVSAVSGGVSSILQGLFA